MAKCLEKDIAEKIAELEALSAKATPDIVKRPVGDGSDQNYLARPRGSRVLPLTKEQVEFLFALHSFWRSGGAELVRDGLKLHGIKELADDNNRIMLEMLEKHAAHKEQTP
jgi:hypothetical protein